MTTFNSRNKIALALAALGCSIAAQAGWIAAAHAVTPSTGQAVETHERGVFFDWRPVREEALRVAQTSKPSVDQLHRIDVVDSVG